MLFHCPHCRNALNVHQPAPEFLSCDQCGSTFPSEPDATLAHSVTATPAGIPGEASVHSCPHCQNKVYVTNGPVPDVLDCDVCGSTFVSRPDASFECDEETRQVEFAHFKLLEQVGNGAYGVVWKARDSRLDRIVALKIPRRDRLTPNEVERFLAEAQTAAQLRHPGIVSIHDTGRVGHTVYIATDFVEGSTLDQWMADRKMKPTTAAEICAQVADALHHAHECGIIHRDIKPSNIMVDVRDRPYLTDFGLAKRESVDTTIAVEGSLLGTPAYMSPEQARGEAHWADRRSDLYSLGVILFQMLTGERPFRGSRQMILKQVLEDDPPHPRQLNNRIPEDIDTICFKCLEKQPSRRYESASEVADELRRFLRGEPIKARPITRSKRALRWCQRNPIITSLVAALALSLVTGLAISTTQWIRANINAHSATVAATRARRSAEMTDAARERTEQYLYVAHMNMAQQAYELADPQRVLEILDRHRPSTPTATDRRSFEWYFWRRQAERWSKALPHGGALNDVAISPGGATIAVATSDGKIALWDTVLGKQVHELHGHQGDVYAVAWSPQHDHMLVSSGADRMIRVWDTSEGSQSFQVPVDRAAFSLDFSADGRTMLSGGADTLVRRWDVDLSREAKPLREQSRWEGHFDFVYRVAISSDGSKAASCGLDRTVRLWDVETGTLEQTMTGHQLEVWAVAFSPDGAVLASGSADHSVRLWHVHDGSLITTLQGHSDRVRDVLFSPDGSLLVSASHDRTIRLWDMTAESKPLEVTSRNINRRDHHFFERMDLPNSDFPKDEFKGHAGHVTSLAWSGNGKTLVSASIDATARTWNVSDLQQRSSLRDHEKTVNAIAVSSDGRMMLSGSNDRTARFWDLSTMQQVGQAVGHQQMVLAVALSPDGKMYATGSYDRTVRLGSLAGADPIELEGHQRAVSSLAFSPDSSLLASGSHDGTVRIWDVETAQLQLTFSAHKGRVQAVVFLADGSIASCGADSVIRIWDAGTGRTLRELPGHSDSVWALAVSPNGSLLASGGEDRSLRLWDLNSNGEPICAVDAHAEPIRSIAFCPDGKTVATGSDDKTIKFWDVVTGEPKSAFKGHRYRVWSLAFTPQAERLLSASLLIRIWNAPRHDGNGAESED